MATATVCEPAPKRKRSDFSIEHILRSAGERAPAPDSRFQWLYCTRYRPPKLPRSRRNGTTQKRKLGRNPRIPFSSAQVAILEDTFQKNQYLSSSNVADLSSLLQLSESRVKIWFQNRRARERRESEVRRQSSEKQNSNSTRDETLQLRLDSLQAKSSETSTNLTEHVECYNVSTYTHSLFNFQPGSSVSAFPINCEYNYPTVLPSLVWGER